MRLLLLMAVIIFFFASCRKKVYYRFTPAEEAFLVYKEGDSFRLKNENTGDTLTYNITDRFLNFQADKLNLSLFKKHYYHRGQVSWGNGYIYIFKDGFDDRDFQIEISIGVIEATFGGNGNNFEVLPSLDINGTTYTTVFKFTGDLPAYTYFNQTYGFLKLEYPDSNWVYTRVP